MFKTLAHPCVLGLVCLQFAGCENDHPYSKLDRFRILAVRADRPDLHQGQTTTLDALTYTPDGAPVSYRWSWCPWTLGSNDGFTCVVTQDELDALGLPLPALDLGTEATARFDYPGPASLVQGLCESFLDGLPPASRKNFPDCAVVMPVTIRLTVSDGETELVAVKEIDLLVDPDRPPNLNPALGDLQASNGGAAFTVEDASALMPEEDYTLEVGLEASSDETYIGRDETGAPLERRELLSFTWLSTGGQAAHARTGTVDLGEGLQDAVRNGWTAPGAEDGIRLMVVVRDDRGGVDWLERTIDVRGGAR